MPIYPPQPVGTASTLRPQLGGAGDGTGAGRHLQLAEGMLEVLAHRRLGDPELRRDLTVGLARGDAVDNLTLPARETDLVVEDRGGDQQACVVGDDPGAGAVGDGERFAQVDGAVTAESLG